MNREVEKIMSLDRGRLVSREQVSRICRDCGEKMERKGMVAVRAEVLQKALSGRAN